MTVRELMALLIKTPLDYEIVLGDDDRTYRVVELGDTSIAEEEVLVVIERTGGKP